MKTKVWLRPIACFILMGVLLLPYGRALAYSSEDYGAIASDTAYFNPNKECNTDGPVQSGSNQSTGVYILGDSITVRAAETYKQQFSSKGLQPSISGEEGRSWNGAGNGRGVGTLGPAKTAITTDSTTVASAGKIIVALGTNGYAQSNPVNEIITAIRAVNASASIWWVNVANGPPDNKGVPDFNQQLDQAASAGKITVIPWNKTVDPSGDGTHNPNGVLEDGTHPKIPDGVNQLVALVVGTITGGGGATNQTLSSSGLGASCRCGGGGNTLSGNDNIAKIYNFLIGKGFSDFQAAGILGNMYGESHYEPRLVEYGFPNSRGEISHPGQPSSLDDNMPPSVNSNGQPGYGLVQWTAQSYKDDLVKISQEKGISVGDLGLQLDYLWHTLTDGYKKGLADRLKQTSDIAAATALFESDFEVHTGPPAADRVAEAQRILDLVHAGGIQSETGGSTATTNSTTGTKPIIVLDPGHSGTTTPHTDPATGLYDGDSYNHPENEGMFDVATIAKTKLEQDGYQVVMTKQAASDVVFLRDRANIANNAHADLAVSLHSTGNRDFGTWQEIYTQKVGLFRGEGANIQTFTDEALAQKSQQYAQSMKEARDATEVISGTTEIKDNDFTSRGFPIPPGNIPEVQLWSKVPWIYLEAGGGANNEGLNEQQKGTFASAVVAGIEKAIPSSGKQNCAGPSGTGDLMATIKKYAWPDYKGHGFMTKTPDYEAAVQKAVSDGRYVGGFQGVDCGGFVTTAMVDSGFDPHYNHDGKGGPTGTQLQWAKDNWQEIGPVQSTADLKLGDVAFYTHTDGSDYGHTFIYVGEQPGFNGPIASASLGNRAPMADTEEKIGPDGWSGGSVIRWYRKK